MAQDLDEYLRENHSEDFTPAPQYFATGDYVAYHFGAERSYAHRVDDLLTVYLSTENDELVGCKIKCVKHILDSAGEFGVLLDDGSVRMGILFFYGAARATDDAKRRPYEELGRIAKDKTFRREAAAT
jgi:hypothetical protein